MIAITVVEDFMLRDLTIQNYRCFKDFHIDGLAQVNLIVGMNNSGKTSLLEAIYLLVNKINSQSLVYLLHKRGEIIERLGLSMSGEPQHHQIEYQVRHLFYNHRPSLEQIISFRSTSYPQSSILLQTNQQKPSFFGDILKH
ncbi:AAA family ATPase [Limnofasciculus baicalensis]|uniref:ATP-binding protein n=1 Tax=Limnofasciculus baicalensis BBK-W-15 TaxID=2699891 RepID=A0AAE3GXK9_9CYAN|nr:AAA family ATPase [Limnofasciculus baicalensis]MCP2732470.1 ATP-binding protein [Limnofasciculus baicalensis BBK-W-15]